MELQTDFAKEEFKLIVESALELISRRKLTAINLIHDAAHPLPEAKIIFHYLHDSEKQMQAIRSKIAAEYPAKVSIVPRITFYRLDPRYVKKMNFKQEYEEAKFLDEDFQEVRIEDVIKNPAKKIVYNQELDLLVSGLSNTQIVSLSEEIIHLEERSPFPWIHPAIIINDSGDIVLSGDYVRKDYASIKRVHSEFYSILPFDNMKRYLDTSK